MSDFDQALAAALAMSPVCIGATEAIKRAGLPARWNALVSIVVGVLLALGCAAAGWFGLSFDEWPDALLVGLVSGLVGAGLYGGVKAAANGTNGTAAKA